MAVKPVVGEGQLAWMIDQPIERRYLLSTQAIDMRFGYSEIFSCEPDRDLAFLSDVVPFLDEAGFDTLWVPEHVVQFDEYTSEYPYGSPGRQGVTRTRPEEGNRGTLGYPDGLVLLAAAAQMSARLRFGTYVLILPERSPVVLARQLATLDHMTNGRFNLGVGVGWSQEEYEAIGVPFARRGARMDEYLDVLRELWTSDPTSFSGEFVDFPALRAYPKPKQSPHPPIYVGGQSKRGLRRAAEKGDGLLLYNLNLPDLEIALDEFDRQLERVGRKLENVDVVVGRRNEGRTVADWKRDSNYIDDVAALGVVNEIVFSPRFPGAEAWFEYMEGYVKELGLNER